MDTARNTKGVTENILRNCVENLTAAEHSVEMAKKEEFQLSEVIRGEVTSLLEIQNRSLQVKCWNVLLCQSYFFSSFGDGNNFILLFHTIIATVFLMVYYYIILCNITLVTIIL